MLDYLHGDEDAYCILRRDDGIAYPPIYARQFFYPDGLPELDKIAVRRCAGKVLAVRAGSTRTIYVSGQVSVDADNNVVGHGDLAQQAEVALENLSKALAAAGATPADVVRLGIYIKDYQRDQADIISAALRKRFVAGRMPASTWLGVASLALDELLIEIDATAVIDAE
jgi:enamine deaminase RidA (YjgF/YER057c/UK114 family)